MSMKAFNDGHAGLPLAPDSGAMEAVAHNQGMADAARQREVWVRWGDGSVGALLLALTAGYALISNQSLMLTLLSVVTTLCVAAIVASVTAWLAARLQTGASAGGHLLWRCLLVSALAALCYEFALTMFRALSRHGTPAPAFYIAVLFAFSVLVLVHGWALKSYTGFPRALGIALVSQLALFGLVVSGVPTLLGGFLFRMFI